jgi:hypothetical protein
MPGNRHSYRALAVMAGHEEGIISMGMTLDQAANRVLKVNLDRQKR